MRARPRLATTAKTLATFTLAIFLALFITNMIFQVMLNREEKRRDELIEEINKNSYVEEQIKNISSATNLYKDVRKGNPDVTKLLSQIVSAMQEDLSIDSVNYEREDKAFEIISTTNRATAYALMLARVLNIDKVDSVTIDYVSYSPKRIEYTGNFIIKVK